MGYTRYVGYPQDVYCIRTEGAWHRCLAVAAIRAHALREGLLHQRTNGCVNSGEQSTHCLSTVPALRANRAIVAIRTNTSIFTIHMSNWSSGVYFYFSGMLAL